MMSMKRIRWTVFSGIQGQMWSIWGQNHVINLVIFNDCGLHSQFLRSSIPLFNYIKNYHFIFTCRLLTSFFRKVPHQPILLKSRKIKPEPNGMHHHTDYSIYYYSNDKKQNPIEVFDVEQCFFGKYHRFMTRKISTTDS